MCYNDIVTQTLAVTSDAKHLYLAGCNWPDKRFSEQIAHALAKTRNPWYLYHAGLDLFDIVACLFMP